MLPLSLGHKHHRGLADLPRACWGGAEDSPGPESRALSLGLGQEASSRCQVGWEDRGSGRQPSVIGGEGPALSP